MPTVTQQISGSVQLEYRFTGSHQILALFSIIFKVPITSWEIDGETVETVSDFIFLGPKSLQMVTAAMKLKDAYSLEGKL